MGHENPGKSQRPENSSGNHSQPLKPSSTKFLGKVALGGAKKK